MTKVQNSSKYVAEPENSFLPHFALPGRNLVEFCTGLWMAAQPNDSGAFSLRAATEADLDDIANVAIAAFPDDPEFDYRFPYRKDYPEDNWKWTRREYQGYLAQPSKYAVLVAVTDVATEKGTISRAIALGVWDVAVNVKPVGDGIGKTAMASGPGSFA
jgi:hypothetical protein